MLNKKVINGRNIANEILNELISRVQSIKSKHNIIPTLAIILIGDNSASVLYAKKKIETAKKVGIHSILMHLPVETKTIDVLKLITKLNNDNKVSGIIVQLPLPKHFNTSIITSSIDITKDVDGFHPTNVGYLHNNTEKGLIPGTALGCIALIKHVEKKLVGKHAVIIGRSNIVGKPLSALLLRENCTVTICHSYTQDIQNITAKADIVISAIGLPLKLTTEYFNSNSIVIDVGINKIENNKIVGDVDFNNVIDKVRFITPVPGGVGPMTIAFLLKNTISASLNLYIKERKNKYF